MVRHFEMSRKSSGHYYENLDVRFVMLRLALTTCYENREVRHSLCAYDVIKKRKWRRSMRSPLKPQDTQYYISG